MKQGDITIQGQAVVLPVAAMGTFSRDMTAATGSVAYSGLGFKPSSILFFVVQSNNAWSWGFSNQVGNFATFIQNTFGGGSYENARCIRLEQTAGNTQYASVSSLDVDGFTLSWTKVLSPTGTGNIVYMAFK
jgi:hypothetical protein